MDKIMPAQLSPAAQAIVTEYRARLRRFKIAAALFRVALAALVIAGWSAAGVLALR